jgi:hypothetical protein
MKPAPSRESNVKVGDPVAPCILEEGGVVILLRRESDQAALSGITVKLGPRRETTDGLGMATFEKVEPGQYPIAFDSLDDHLTAPKLPALTVTAGVHTKPLIVDLKVELTLVLRDAEGELLSLDLFQKYDASLLAFGSYAADKPPAFKVIVRAGEGAQPAPVALFDADGERIDRALALFDPAAWVYGDAGKFEERPKIFVAREPQRTEALVELFDAEGEKIDAPIWRFDSAAWSFGAAGKLEAKASAAISREPLGKPVEFELRDAEGAVLMKAVCDPAAVAFADRDRSQWAFGN